MNHNKIVCFDVESNGLHGEAFAVGGVVWTIGNKIPDDTIYFAVPVDDPTDWVKANVLPDMKPPTHTRAQYMRNAFWDWLMQNKTDALVCGDVIYPVEARFLIACQNDDIAAREWDAPYPLYDVSSLLLAAGIDPDSDRVELARIAAKQMNLIRFAYVKHDPNNDAIASAICAMYALETLRNRKTSVSQVMIGGSGNSQSIR